MQYIFFVCSLHILQWTDTHTCTQNRFMALMDFFRDYPVRAGWDDTREVKPGFTGARDREQQWHQLGHMQICTLTQTHNHASIPPLSFLQAGCPSCCPTNSVKALKACQCIELTLLAECRKGIQSAKTYSNYFQKVSFMEPGTVWINSGKESHLNKRPKH